MNNILSPNLSDYKREKSSNSFRKKHISVFIPVAAGLFGYGIFSTTMILTFLFTNKLFGIGTLEFRLTDALISLLGFGVLFIVYFRKRNKN